VYKTVSLSPDFYTKPGFCVKIGTFKAGFIEKDLSGKLGIITSHLFSRRKGFRKDFRQICLRYSLLSRKVKVFVNNFG